MQTDITIHRHKSNPNSAAANEKAAIYQNSWRLTILHHLETIGETTVKEFANVWGLNVNAISGRFSELKRDNKIIETGENRDEYAIVRLFRKGDPLNQSTIKSCDSCQFLAVELAERDAEIAQLREQVQKLTGQGVLF